VDQPDFWAGDSDSSWFIVMADTQLGMYATPLPFAMLGWTFDQNSFERETVNMELAIEHANRLRPGFVIVCGDLVNTPGHAGQIAEFQRIAGLLDEEIPLYLVSGNHDVRTTPTPETLAAYREIFGPDWYSFREGDVYGIVLNSQLIYSPGQALDEADAQLEWLRTELATAKDSGAEQVLVFVHYPFFLEHPEEEDGYFKIPHERRDLYLWLFREADVRAIFAGHYDENSHGWDGDLEMVTTGPIGKPIGNDPSGLRIVRVGPEGLDHIYFALDAIPEQLGAAGVGSPAE
jgi:3',5'-cyclic AMP phosphodiesterase CpdA